MHTSHSSLEDSVPDSGRDVKPNVGGDDGVWFSLDSEGRELTAEQEEYFKDSKVRDELGRLMVMYHGSPNGSHTRFRSGTYFTPNREYADKYRNPNASMLSTKKNADAPKTYEVYLNITKPFDTRNPRERKIFMEEYYRKWGTGAPLADSGLPDWTDGMDLQEFIEEMGYYRVRISAAQGTEGNVVYNIGKIERRSHPTMDGSSAKCGALGRETSSKAMVAYPIGDVKDDGVRFSYGGENAKSADREALQDLLEQDNPKRTAKDLYRNTAGEEEIAIICTEWYSRMVGHFDWMEEQKRM